MTDVVTDTWRFLRAHTKGDLQFEEHVRPLKYVVAPDGRLAAPVMVAMLATLDLVLLVPADSDAEDEVLELGLTLTEIDERGEDGAVCDRWRIYHGDPDDVRWAILGIDAARFHGAVIDGEMLSRPNPLADVEAALCREMNAGGTDTLRQLCLHFAGTGVEDPMLVGVDPDGLDVRGRFEVLRVPFDPPVTSADEVRERIESLLAGLGA